MLRHDRVKALIATGARIMTDLKVVFIRFGTKPATDQNHTDKCGICTPTRKAGLLPGMMFDSEGDAATTALNPITGFALLQAYVPALWHMLWDDFKCDSKDCSEMEGCGNAPTWFEYGAITQVVQPPPGAAVPAKVCWALYMDLAREIKCVKSGGGDSDPQIPEIPKVPEPHAPEPQGDDFKPHLGKLT